GQETRLAEQTVRPVALRTAADGTVVADFGVVIPARPVVRFHAGVTGHTVPIRAGYTLTGTGRVATSTLMSQGTDMSFPYTQTDGEQEFRAFTHLAFRYLEIPDAGEEIALDDVSAVVVHTDVPPGGEATFASSDATLDAVWAMMARSALYSVQEAFVDTPTREKGQFLGDATNISYATMGAYGERDATQQAIREFLRSAARYWNTGDDRGRYNAVYPNGDGKRDIPDYSLMFVDWVWRYWTESGDRDLLAEAYPAIRDTADYVLRHIPATGPTAGLVTELAGGSGAYRFGIVDWPEPGRFGYDM
ncbi:family 78 glycoside hydrolase catalytic domain, partial [Micromonospora azadirachtae]